MTGTIHQAPKRRKPSAVRSYLDVWRATPHTRHTWIKAGYPAQDAKALLQALTINQAVVFRALNLSVATVNKKAKAGGSLTTDESERVLGVAKLVGQLEAIVEESGDSTGFDAASWIELDFSLAERAPACPGGRQTDRLAGHHGGPGARVADPSSDPKCCVRLSKSVWRIGTDVQNYQADDLSGKGAEITGGRWNAAGAPVTYAAETRALACLETLVHLNAGGLPLNRYLVEIIIPDAVWRKARVESSTTLPVGWDALPASQTSIEYGTAWLRATSSALLVTPSAIVPEEPNILINPRHPDSAAIKARKVRKWTYDPRLSGA